MTTTQRESAKIDRLFLVTLYGYVCVLFVIDQVVPLGVAIGYLYALAIIPAVFLIQSQRAINRLTAFSILLIVLGYLSSSGDHLAPANLANLVLGILCNIVWAFFCGLYARETRRLVATEAALQRSNRELSQYAYVASHDLQAPVRQISAFSDFLAGELEEQPSTEQANDYLQTIQECAVRMALLIKSILTFSRIGSQTPKFETFSMSTLTSDMEQLFDADLERLGATISFSGYTGPVVADRAHLARLMQNLISNALKFMAEDTTPVIQVHVEQEQKVWRVSVRDNGIGIKPEYRRRIFRAFQRLHSSEQYEGTGIGLAVCAKIAELHGGRIWLDTAEGPGSCFVFTLNRDYDSSTFAVGV